MTPKTNTHGIVTTVNAWNTPTSYRSFLLTSIYFFAFKIFYSFFEIFASILIASIHTAAPVTSPFHFFLTSCSLFVVVLNNSLSPVSARNVGLFTGAWPLPHDQVLKDSDPPSSTIGCQNLFTKGGIPGLLSHSCWDLDGFDLVEVPQVLHPLSHCVQPSALHNSLPHLSALPFCPPLSHRVAWSLHRARLTQTIIHSWALIGT